MRFVSVQLMRSRTLWDLLGKPYKGFTTLRQQKFEKSHQNLCRLAQYGHIENIHLGRVTLDSSIASGEFLKHGTIEILLSILLHKTLLNGVLLVEDI